MNVDERWNIIHNYAVGKLNKRKVNKLIPGIGLAGGDLISDLLLETVLEKSNLMLNDLLIVDFKDSVFCSRQVPELSELLYSDWHEKHEEIVFTLGKIGDWRSAKSIYDVANSPFANQDWDDGFALARKCCYALKGIRTDEALELLGKLADDPRRQVSKTARKLAKEW